MLEPGSAGRAKQARAARILLLPGAYESADGFRSAGFPDAVRARGLPVELHYAAYETADLADPQATARLREQVLAPVHAAGGGPWWLAGVSLGGYVALQCAFAEPLAIDGVCLLAPYLGGRTLIAEIAAAAGLAAWEPGAIGEHDDDRRLWLRLKQHAAARTGPRLYLGAGSCDRFARAQALLAAALPPRAVDHVPGGHDWPTWRRLWDNFLDSDALA